MRLAARPRIVSGARNCTTVRRIPTLIESVKPRTNTAATAIQNHCESPRSARLAAKKRAAMTAAAPFRFMSPAMSSDAEHKRGEDDALRPDELHSFYHTPEADAPSLAFGLARAPHREDCHNSWNEQGRAKKIGGSQTSVVDEDSCNRRPEEKARLQNHRVQGDSVHQIG